MEEKTETERVVEALKQIGVECSPETIRGMITTYNSHKGNSQFLTLEKVAQIIGQGLSKKTRR